MKTVLTIKDQVGDGKVTNEVDVPFYREVVTIKDIIEARVWKEVEDYNEELPEYFMGLVQPSNTDKVANGYRMKNHQLVDGEHQIYIALDGFMKKIFVLIINGKQAENLNDEVTLSKHTSINFIKLTPLIGG